jgi:hypothetical protein
MKSGRRPFGGSIQLFGRTCKPKPIVRPLDPGIECSPNQSESLLVADDLGQVGDHGGPDLREQIREALVAGDLALHGAAGFRDPFQPFDQLRAGAGEGAPGPGETPHWRSIRQATVLRCPAVLRAGAGRSTSLRTRAGRQGPRASAKPRRALAGMAGSNSIKSHENRIRPLPDVSQRSFPDDR